MDRDLERTFRANRFVGQYGRGGKLKIRADVVEFDPIWLERLAGARPWSIRREAITQVFIEPHPAVIGGSIPLVVVVTDQGDHERFSCRRADVERIAAALAASDVERRSVAVQVGDAHELSRNQPAPFRWWWFELVATPLILTALALLGARSWQYVLAVPWSIWFTFRAGYMFAERSRVQGVNPPLLLLPPRPGQGEQQESCD